MRLDVNVKVYSFTGLLTHPVLRFPVHHVENLKFIMQCGSTIFDLKDRYRREREVSVDRQYLIQPLRKGLQKDEIGPEHFICEEISEFANSNKFSDYNVCDGEVFALLVDECEYFI